MFAPARLRKLLSRLSFIFLLLSLWATVQAERLPIKIYTSADGLGSSAAFSLVRDHRGFIWFCSRDGLVRFDGLRFITYRIGSDDDDPAVFSLLPTTKGVYWINLNRGTDYRFIDKGNATPFAAMPQPVSKSDQRVQLNNVEPLIDLRFPEFEDHDGNLWSWEPRGLDLLSEVDGKTVRQLVELPLPGNPDPGLTFAKYRGGSDLSFWVGTNWGLVRRLADRRFVHFTFDPQQTSNRIALFAEDKENHVWIARDEGVLVLKVEPASQLSGLGPFTTRQVTVKPGNVEADGKAQLPSRAGEAFSFSFQDLLRRMTGKKLETGAYKPKIYDLLCARDGTVWITTLAGLVSYDGRRFQHFTEDQGLASRNIAGLAEDNDGNIWIGSYGGLMRLSPKGLTSFGSGDGMRERGVHAIYETSAGDLYFVTNNWNVSAYRNGAFKSARPRLPDDVGGYWHSNVAYLDSRGEWWVITNKQLLRFSGIKQIEELEGREPTSVYTDQNGLLANQTNGVFEDSRGDLWIGTDPTGDPPGLTRWERATGKFYHHQLGQNGLPQDGYATAVAEDRAGNLWFALADGGLRRYRDGRFFAIEPKEGSIPSGIMGLFTDSKGRLWVASSIGGLVRIEDPTAERPLVRRYTIADGLTSNNIRCVTEDFFGNIYVGTVRGVNRLSPETGRIRYYGTGDGLPGDFVRVVHRDREGAIWFGTFSGLAKLIPEPDVIEPPPPTLISRVRIAGVDYSISPLGQSEVNAPEQAANNNNLEIDFFSISSGGSAGMRYQYELEGGDGKWSQPSNQRTVTFANLSPGSYRFRVRSVNADGVASENQATLTFRILRPVWQRWWFIAIVMLLVVGGVIALDRYRVAHAKQLGAVREERLRELERVRKRIATDLHDDIGSALTQISILSEVATQQLPDGQSPASRPLGMIANSSRELIDSMSDIVWAINPQKDHLSDLTGRMRRFAADMLTARNIEFSFRGPEAGFDRQLGANVRREVFLIFKESLNNIAKHAESKMVDIEIRFDPDQLVLRIEDDGKGFDPSLRSDGHGLLSMRDRARGLSGDLTIESQSGRGTKTTLVVPLDGRH